MDIRCTFCGEPWDIGHVLHDAEPGSFERRGEAIVRCPACDELGEAPPEERAMLRSMRELGELMAGDPDGYAASIEDFLAVGLLGPTGEDD